MILALPTSPPLTALPLPAIPHYSTAALKRVVQRLETANIALIDIPRDEVIIRLEPLNKQLATSTAEVLHRDHAIVALASFLTIVAVFYAFAPWLA